MCLWFIAVNEYSWGWGHLHDITRPVV